MQGNVDGWFMGERISPGGSGEGDILLHLAGDTGGLCWSWKYPSALLDAASSISGV